MANTVKKTYPTLYSSLCLLIFIMKFQYGSWRERKSDAHGRLKQAPSDPATGSCIVSIYHQLLSSYRFFHISLAGYNNKNEDHINFLWNCTKYKSYTFSQFMQMDDCMCNLNLICGYFKALRPRQMAAIFQTTLSNAFSWMKMILIKISLMFVPNSQINNIPALV